MWKMAIQKYQRILAIGPLKTTTLYQYPVYIGTTQGI